MADLVFQGAKLRPVAGALRDGAAGQTVMRQNLALSIGYNVIMVPLAIGGLGYAVACRGGDVEFVAAGDGEQPASAQGCEAMTSFCFCWASA